MQQSRRAIITGTGAYVPEKVMNNHDFEKLVDTSDEWITTRTGIKERRISEPGQATSDLCANAGKQAIENAGLKPEDIDLIIVATVTPDHLFPSTACRAQAKLGCVNAGAFDMMAACSGFCYALNMAASHIACGMAERVLVFGAETLSKFVDYTDRTSCILFGDGAGAAVMEATEEDGRGFAYGHMGADGTGGDMMIIPAGGSAMPASHETVDGRQHAIVLHGREVFKFAVNKMSELVIDAAEKCGATVGDIALLVPHQVNTRIIVPAAERAGISQDRIFINIHKYGNTSGASIAIALHEANVEGRMKPGDLVVMVGFGGGLTWSSAAIRW